jgi:AbrB family looped-hinge helix DNA binding protein
MGRESSRRGCGRLAARLRIPERLGRWAGLSQALRLPARGLGATLVRDGVRRYLTAMKTTVSSRGQIVLPAEIRDQDQIRAGQQFEVERLDRGEYRLRRCGPRPNEGLVDWLLACPSKGYFVPVEGESTDSM